MIACETAHSSHPTLMTLHPPTMDILTPSLPYAPHPYTFTHPTLQTLASQAFKPSYTARPHILTPCTPTLISQGGGICTLSHPHMYSHIFTLTPLGADIWTFPHPDTLTFTPTSSHPTLTSSHPILTPSGGDVHLYTQSHTFTPHTLIPSHPQMDLKKKKSSGVYKTLL